jgi:hypothetical protein
MTSYRTSVASQKQKTATDEARVHLLAASGILAITMCQISRRIGLAGVPETPDISRTSSSNESTQPEPALAQRHPPPARRPSHPFHDDGVGERPRPGAVAHMQQNPTMPYRRLGSGATAQQCRRRPGHAPKRDGDQRPSNEASHPTTVHAPANGWRGRALATTRAPQPPNAGRRQIRRTRVPA